MINIIFGKERGIKSDFGFRVMCWAFAVRDRLLTPWALLNEFGIQEGQTVVDYGCGPGSYLKRASELAGPKGLVLAVDVHDSAIRAVSGRIEEGCLKNVRAVRAEGNRSTLPDETADVIYALDMFHMIAEPAEFLRELNRICRRTGLLFIDTGHQSRAEARSKIASSRSWEILEETKRYMKCRPAGRFGEALASPA